MELNLNDAQRLKRVEDKIAHLEGVRDPFERNSQINDILSKLDQYQIRIDSLDSIVRQLLGRKIIASYTDQEIKMAWIESAMTQKDVAAYFGVTEGMAAEYCNARIQDVQKRHDIMTVFIRAKIRIEEREKIKQINIDRFNKEREDKQISNEEVRRRGRPKAV